MAGWIFDLFGWDNRPGLFQCTVGDSTVDGLPATLIGLVYWARASKRRRRGRFVPLQWPAESVVQSMPALFVAGGRIVSRSSRATARSSPATFAAAARFISKSDHRIIGDLQEDFCAAGVFDAAVGDVQTFAESSRFQLRSRVIAFLATKDRRIVVLRRSERRRAS